ncbi:hypothetical protein EV359DRAFT_69048 [Lentinula novae-zelandiae]|nr:hypothetical protein EV359DRAFT_69048 [Lentinula novae-zelandiae]
MRSLAIWFRPPWDSHNDDVPIAYTELFCCALANMHGLVDLQLHLSHQDIEWQQKAFQLTLAALQPILGVFSNGNWESFLSTFQTISTKHPTLALLSYEREGVDTIFETLHIYPGLLQAESGFSWKPISNCFSRTTSHPHIGLERKYVTCSNMKQLSPIISLIPGLHELTFGHWFSPTTPYRGQLITNSDRFSLAKTLEGVCPELWVVVFLDGSWVARLHCPIHVTAHFLSLSSVSSPFEVPIRVLKKGRNFTSLKGDLVQGVVARNKSGGEGSMVIFWCGFSENMEDKRRKGDLEREVITLSNLPLFVNISPSAALLLLKEDRKGMGISNPQIKTNTNRSHRTPPIPIPDSWFRTLTMTIEYKFPITVPSNSSKKTAFTKTPSPSPSAKSRISLAHLTHLTQTAQIT